jgi:hypothetical protein
MEPSSNRKKFKCRYSSISIVLGGYFDLLGGAMFNAKAILISSTFLLQSGPLPHQVDAAVTGSYSCRLGVVHEDLPDGEFEQSFAVPAVASGDSHGGTPLEFKFSDQRVEVLADGKWLALSWWVKEKRIAEVVSVLGAESKDARVLIAYDPENPENNQASLDCALP